MRVSKKYDDFLNTLSKVDFLEGTTAAGKTTVAIYKFMLDVADSDKPQHILAALDGGVIEKNIINEFKGDYVVQPIEIFFKLYFILIDNLSFYIVVNVAIGIEYLRLFTK